MKSSTSCCTAAKATTVVTRSMRTATMIVIRVLVISCMASSVNAAFLSYNIMIPTTSISTSTSTSTTGFSLPLHHVRSSSSPFQMVAANGDVDRIQDSSSSNYQLAPDAGPIATATCQLTEKDIHSLIAQRSAAKSARQFEEADQILETLKEAGVHLHDKRKEWRADGNNHFGRTTNGNDRHRQYARRGGAHGLAEDALDEIAGMVERRAQAKRVRDFLSYNQLGEALKTTYGVHVNDKKREWSMSFVTSDEEVISVYVPSPIAPQDDPTHTMDDETKALIQKRLTDRLMARRARDYALADFIKGKLKEEYSVVIDDRTREWTIATSDEENDVGKKKKLEEEGSSSTVMADTTPLEISSQNLMEGDDATHNDAIEKAEQPEIPKEQETASHLMTLTILVLKEKLREAGLPVSGKKAELVQRLLDTSN